jgi:hypothetical protein
VQNQVGGFIISIVAAMPEKQFRLVETAYRETQKVANRV